MSKYLILKYSIPYSTFHDAKLLNRKNYTLTMKPLGLSAWEHRHSQKMSWLLTVYMHIHHFQIPFLHFFLHSCCKTLVSDNSPVLQDVAIVPPSHSPSLTALLH